LLLSGKVTGGLADGERMLALGTAILQSAHDTLPGGDDDDRWNEFSAVFVSGLVRRAFIQLRDSQVRCWLDAAHCCTCYTFRGLSLSLCVLRTHQWRN